MVETLYLLSHKKTANEILSAMQENPSKNTSYDTHEEW